MHPKSVPIANAAMPQPASAFRRFGRTAAALLTAVLFGLPLLSASAAAHPHVFVTVTTTVEIENGTITGFDHVWVFDEFYSAMAIQGLDKNGDGVYDREELAELADINMEGLKEFKYFTFPTLGTQEISIADPNRGEYWLEHKDGILSLHFKARMEKPVLTEAQDFQFGIYDPSFFIAFEIAKQGGVKLGRGAPASCRTFVGEPKEDADAARALGEAFFAQQGGANIGFTFAQNIRVKC